MLDDKPLKKLITFDDGEESGSQGPELPVSVKKMCPSVVESVVLQFIQQYFQVYDTDDRSPLEAAYHQEALFSVTSAYPPGTAILFNRNSVSNPIFHVKMSQAASLVRWRHWRTILQL